MVYTGIHLNKLQAIDEKVRTFQADFDLWFRYSGELDTENIVFPDAVTPIRLAKPTIVRDLLGNSIERSGCGEPSATPPRTAI